jgi:hypothetical protein
VSKYFVVNPSIQLQDKNLINKLRQENEIVLAEGFSKKREADINKLSQEDNLRHIEGRVVVKVDMDGKDSWTFEDGNKIEYKRRFNNLNRSQTEPINAIVISGEGLKKGAEILVHFNAIHDSNRIFDYKDHNESIQYYSIHNDMCFAWFDEDEKEWKAIEPYQLALRVFQPYDGIITGIEPKKIKDVLYVLHGKLKGKVCKTIVASDYEVVAQGRNGRELSLIRFRPFGDAKNKREEETIAILEDLTDKVLSGGLLIGITTTNCKKIQEIFPNDRP